MALIVHVGGTFHSRQHFPGWAVFVSWFSEVYFAGKKSTQVALSMLILFSVTIFLTMLNVLSELALLQGLQSSAFIKEATMLYTEINSAHLAECVSYPERTWDKKGKGLAPSW